MSDIGAELSVLRGGAQGPLEHPLVSPDTIERCVNPLMLLSPLQLLLLLVYKELPPASFAMSKGADVAAVGVDAVFCGINGKLAWGSVGGVVAKDTCLGGMHVSDCCWRVGWSMSFPWKMQSSLLVRSLRLSSDVDFVTGKLF